MDIILNEEQQTKMRDAGWFNAQLMDEVRELVKPGAVLVDIDKFVHDYTVEHGHVPAPLGYKGFPKSCCISINNVICHGIPHNYELQDGDIVNIDLTSIVDGWHGDSSETFLVGECKPQDVRLVQCAFDALYKGIDAIKPNGPIREIGFAITHHAHLRNFTVVRNYMGHGVGLNFHQQPNVPHYPHKQLGDVVIMPGTCFTIEPMINAGKIGAILDETDKWTVRTADGKNSAQFEHTILMTEEGPEILTLTKNGPQRGHKF
jgi:methionyl aminopeptidase